MKLVIFWGSNICFLKNVQQHQPRGCKDYISNSSWLSHFGIFVPVLKPDLSSWCSSKSSGDEGAHQTKLEGLSLHTKMRSNQEFNPSCMCDYRMFTRKEVRYTSDSSYQTGSSEPSLWTGHFQVFKLVSSSISTDVLTHFSGCNLAHFLPSGARQIQFQLKPALILMPDMKPQNRSNVQVKTKKLCMVPDKVLEVIKFQWIIDRKKGMEVDIGLTSQKPRGFKGSQGVKSELCKKP